MNRSQTLEPPTGAFGEQLSFIEPAPFSPEWPKPTQLPGRALKMLMRGETFDHEDFWIRCGSWRLADVIYRLIGMGWPVESILIPSPSDECPGRCTAVYRLPQHVLVLAKAARPGAHP